MVKLKNHAVKLASSEQLQSLLSYCIDFARVMLRDLGGFYPFGAVLGSDGSLKAVGGYGGDEHPNPHEIYYLLREGFVNSARDGSINAAALAASVTIPSRYSPPAKDGLRVHLENPDISRLIYVPYRISKPGFFNKTPKAVFFEPITVHMRPAIFARENCLLGQPALNHYSNHISTSI